MQRNNNSKRSSYQVSDTKHRLKTHSTGVWYLEFDNCFFLIPGVIVIVLFGLGNIIAAMFSLRNKNRRQWIPTAIMGGILFITLIVQVIVLGEFYLATVEFMFLSIIQLSLSGYVSNIFRKRYVRQN